MVKIKYNDDDEFWKADKLLSYDADIMIAMSIRNLGKTYSAMQLIKNKVSKGYACCWSRWSDGETKLAMSEFFDGEDIGKNSDKNVWVKETLNSSAYKITHVESGGTLYFLSVKMAYKHKGLDIASLKYWVWDEFLPEFYENQTHKNELNLKFNSLYTTLRRNNPNFRVLLLSNNISWFNALYEQWGISPFPSGEIRTFIQKSNVKLHEGFKLPEIRVVMESVLPTKKQIERVIRDEIMKGSASKIIDYLNNVTRDNFTLYEKCPDLSIPLHPADWVYLGKTYTFRIYKDTLYWIESKPRDCYKWTTNRDEVTDIIKKDVSMIPIFQRYYDTSKMRFENGNVERAILGMIM